MRFTTTAVTVLALLSLPCAGTGCSEESSATPTIKKPSDGGLGGDGSAATDGSKDGGLILEGGKTDAVGDSATAGDGSCECVPFGQQECYSGPSGTKGVGVCKAGISVCAADCKSWGPCTGEIVPKPDTCLDTVDNDCNGTVNDGDHTVTGCACEPGSTKCVANKVITCDSEGDWGPPGDECPICKAGEFKCECNEVMKCDPGPPAKWVSNSPEVLCSVNQKCDAATGKCKALENIGTNKPTGKYYQYALFEGGVFKGGYDVDSEGDFLYVNRGSANLDVYKVTLLDSDGDGLLEPNQHPDNPLETGPIEERVLTFVKTYTSTADGAPLGSESAAELLAAGDRIYTVGPARNGDITEYLFATKTSNVIVHPKNSIELSHMGYGAGDGIWYGSNESARRVFSYCAARNVWIGEFGYPDLAGSHMDGMEAIVSFSTGVQYVYVSDMTSDFIGQYRRGVGGEWVQENLFEYSGQEGSLVEGMGFGALSHFWATGGSILYEIGGGDLTGYLQ